MDVARMSGVFVSSAVLLAACAGVSGGGSRTALLSAADSETSALEFRAVANKLAIRVPGLVELTGDRMLARTFDPELRRRALLWKLDGTAAFQQALFRTDPLGAAVETWALAIQVQDAVESKDLRDTFGNLQPIAQEGARNITAAIEAEARFIVRRPEGYDRLKEFVTEWAHANPISLPFSTRPSIQPLLAQIASSQQLGLMEVFGSVTASVADLNTKLDIYAASLPKSIRWEAELAAIDASRTDTGRLALATLQSANGVLGRANTLLSNEGMKELSGAAVSSLRGEREAVLGDIDRQRIDTFQRLGQERAAVLIGIDGQRAATLADLDAKIARGLEGAERMRAQTMTDVEGMLTRTLVRITVALGALMALGALLVWLVLRSGALRRPPTGN
jgi:hypothetical protein